MFQARKIILQNVPKVRVAVGTTHHQFSSIVADAATFKQVRNSFLEWKKNVFRTKWNNLSLEWYILVCFLAKIHIYWMKVSGDTNQMTSWSAKATKCEPKLSNKLLWWMKQITTTTNSAISSTWNVDMVRWSDWAGFYCYLMTNDCDKMTKIRHSSHVICFHANLALFTGNCPSSSRLDQC